MTTHPTPERPRLAGYTRTAARWSRTFLSLVTGVFSAVALAVAGHNPDRAVAIAAVAGMAGVAALAIRTEPQTSNDEEKVR